MGTNDKNHNDNKTALVVNEQEIRQTFQLSKDFTSTENAAVLKQKALTFVTTLVKSDASSNQKQESIFSMGAAEQQAVIEQGKGFNIKLKDLKVGEEGNQVANIIEELGKKFDEINPGSINWSNAPRKKVAKLFSKLPFVGNAISNYWSKYQDVMKIINENIATLDTLLNKKEQDIALINTKKDAFLQMMKQYHEQIVFAVYVKEALEEAIEQEGDEEKKQFMQENWAYPLSKRIIMLQELYLSSFDAAISAELIARGHRELITDLREKNKVAMVRLQTGVWLAAELYDQKRMLDSMKVLKDTNKKLADAVHTMLGTYQAEIQKEATDSFQSFDQWKTHMQQTIKLYADAKLFRVNALPILDEKINSFGTLMIDAEKTAEDIRVAANTPNPFESEVKK